MKRHAAWGILSAAIAAAAVWASSAGIVAQEIRYVRRDGVLYQEQVCRRWRPVVQTTYQTQEQIVYREEVTTQQQEVTTVVRTPAVEYVWEPYIHGRWNPFRRPALAYRWVPRTVWREEVRKVKMPVTVRKLVPEKRIQRVPVVTQHWVPEEVVVSRVRIDTVPGPCSHGPQSVMVAGTPIGGIRRLDSDPPRRTNIAWRPARSSVQR